jgi:hypothetical protein
MYSVFLISTPAQTPLALRPNGCTLIREESREVFFLWSGILGGRGGRGREFVPVLRTVLL